MKQGQNVLLNFSFKCLKLQKKKKKFFHFSVFSTIFASWIHMDQDSQP